MQRVVVYNMTALESEVCDVLKQTMRYLTVVYGGFEFTLERASHDQPYRLNYGKLQLFSTGEAERPLPVFRMPSEKVVDFMAFRTYRKRS